MNIVAVAVFVFGAIIGSLYIIDPPDITTPDTTTQEQAELDENQSLLEFEQLCVDRLQETRDDSTALTDEQRQAMQEEIDSMRKSIERIAGKLKCNMHNPYPTLPRTLSACTDCTT